MRFGAMPEAFPRRDREQPGSFQQKSNEAAGILKMLLNFY
jgi:hypothetical protein